jgi:catechol 2,3-dioxygenase-like lactoylglutathione lyase family enzyme
MSRFHLSLDVSDLDRSVAFFSLFFGVPPTKRREDYAKFEVSDPDVVLSLERRPDVVRGRLNHAGVRVASAQALVAIQRRLEEGGFSTVREEGVECCYAKQTKFWAADPDGTMWEVYVLEGDVAARGAGRVPLEVRQ